MGKPGQPVLTVTLITRRGPVARILFDKGAVRGRVAGQRLLMFEREVEVGQLLEPLVNAPPIEHQMVGAQGQQVLAGAHPDQPGLPERPLLQCNGHAHPGIEKVQGCIGRVGVSLKVVPHQGHGQLGGETLPRRATLLYPHGTQGIVEAGQVMQCQRQPGPVHLPLQRDIGANVVQRGCALAELLQPDIPLGNGEVEKVGGRHDRSGPSEGSACDSNTGRLPCMAH